MVRRTQRERVLAAEKSPRPEVTTERGHVLIPYWYVLDYLEKTSPELGQVESPQYPQKFPRVGHFHYGVRKERAV